MTDDDRYRDLVATYGEVARTGGTCGMHVHVDIDSDAEGVVVIDRIGPWLPVLLAISANSPFADGRDTGYASWRAQVWSRWPSAGPTERFESVEGYRAASRGRCSSGERPAIRGCSTSTPGSRRASPRSRSGSAMSAPTRPTRC